MVEDIHAILNNREDLSNYEKINYCNSERHYMKQYLKHAMIKINRILPDKLFKPKLTSSSCKIMYIWSR